jgi:hypothetical protein
MEHRLPILVRHGRHRGRHDRKLRKRLRMAAKRIDQFAVRNIEAEGGKADL